ncbi:uncharacterized protein EDB93DRAFT_1241500 [Suillus bovinus]|uniref:uncharacterized protein n=1 Tax=Suillus bovinus TaxID=48563 RepID=UPI001B88531E|nr:uncharacterized protein EDB93DRAFT_1241500 [Suillus bovinus]KAG2142827.1 hypothetical protein EDB93DRAFT_1241500 [Suillus bovinus]
MVFFGHAEVSLTNNTCRICSAPSDLDQPLFYPCKCSGTIRYIHQDCLTTWLSHSKKKTCDVCKHPYSFTKVYAADMPPTLPPLLLFRRLAQQALFAVLFGLRAIMVGTVWLAVLPWITIWTWRVYFTMGESTAWWISGRGRPYADFFGMNSPTVSSNDSFTGFGLPPNATLYQRISNRPFWSMLSADIFAGQIIASLIVLIFVAIFLLREWISQNARPGVFEDEDGGAIHPAPQPGDLPAAAVEEPANVHIPDENGFARNALREAALDARRQAMRARRGAAVAQRQGLRQRDPVEIDRHQALRNRPLDRLPFPLESPPQAPQVPQEQPPPYELNHHSRKGKGRAEEADDTEEGSSELYSQRRTRRRIHTEEEESMTHETADSQDVQPSTSLNGGEALTFPFTFRASSSISSNFREPSRSSDPVVGSSTFNERYSWDEDFHIDSQPTSSSVSPSMTPALHVNIGTPLRRPPMANSTLFAEGATPNKLQPSPALPLSSPSLAMYLAPEELEAGLSSSGPSGYFDDGERSKEELEEELENFFRDPESASPDLPPPSDAQDQTSIATIPDALPEENDEEDDDEGEEDDIPAQAPAAEVDQVLDDEDDEDDDGDGDDLINPRDENVAAPPQIQVALNQAGDLDDLEPGVEDDLDGAMEAIGLRGPILGVFQNAVLMVFVLDTAIGFGIWLPFTFGKTTALLSLDPPRALYILDLPIRAMRVITDPIVDFVTVILGLFIFPSLYWSIRLVLNILLLATRKVTSDDIIEWTILKTTTMWDNAVTSLQNPSPSPAISLSQRLESFLESDSVIVRSLEPYFAILGREVRTASEQLQTSWVNLTMGQGTREKVFAIILGYGVVGVLLAIYLNVFTVGNARSAGRAIRSAVRQQLLVVKVAMFIVIELVIFPLGCGIMLDICTVWVFPEASLESRAAFFTQAPLTAMFYHWVAGTMFMYQFAILLAGCRNIMRPGAMWFIKDPQDQNFHPIRDILDRPTFTQFRKLLISAFMYAMVVACGVATLAVLLFVGNRSIFPLRWKTREPISTVPFALPYTMRYLRPRKFFHRWAVRIWKLVAARLRLTSYMFGERHSDEEFTAQFDGWIPFLRRSSSDIEAASKTSDGTFRRVPASDNIALPKDMRATAEVLEDGTPANPAAEELVAAQNAEAAKAKRDVKNDYLIVYFPPSFRFRIFGFITSVWVIVAALAAIFIAVPMQLGRRFFCLFTSKELHDGYSFLAGLYLLWACYLVAKTVERMDKRRQRRGGDGPRAEFAVFFVKRSLLWLSKIAYMGIFLGIIIPILFALVIDMYIVMPVRLTLNPTLVIHIRIVDMWALGLVYGKIFMRINRRPQFDVGRGIINNGWTHPDPKQATKEVIIPLIAGLLGMLVLPAAAVWGLREFFDLPSSPKFMFMHAYPGIFATVGLYRASVATLRLLSSWSQAIRDKEFLVEMRLQNLEPVASCCYPCQQSASGINRILVPFAQLQYATCDTHNVNSNVGR